MAETKDYWLSLQYPYLFVTMKAMVESMVAVVVLMKKDGHISKSVDFLAVVTLLGMSTIIFAITYQNAVESF